MIKRYFLLVLVFCGFGTYGQDSIRQRLILIGDAGEINPHQSAVLQHAAGMQLPGKTTAFFLGDNVYSSGLGLDASPATLHSEEILRRQFAPLRQAGMPVYFLPGNHDWDHSGPQGYQKIIRANTFLREQGDSLLQMIPADACPGPYEVLVSDELVVIAIDSEWWLFPYDKHTADNDCECKSKADVLGKLEDMLRRHRKKTVVFTSHHPFRTLGSHGGFYSLRQHLFPLADINKRLFIPLPVIGSLYPFLRKAFPPAEDLGNILYKDMVRSLEQVLAQHPNVVHAAGHEHTLQLIRGVVPEIVSGAGCKYTPVTRSASTVYAESNSGYVVADLMADRRLKLRFFALRNDSMVAAFTYYIAHQDAPSSEERVAGTVSGDSVVLPLPGNFDQVSKLHRRLFGENYRKSWVTPVHFPVLRIGQLGLHPTERGGGMQTRSLRLQDSAGKEWVIRSVEKYPDALLPQPLVTSFAADIFRDNVTATFPYAPLVVPVFAKALSVRHSQPAIVYVAPDTALGIYEQSFANTIHIFEPREPAGKSIATLKMMDKLREDNDNAINQEAYLKARMLDIFLGDWDRHADQWRWVDVAKGKQKRYDPVPRDRDQVFYLNQGLFPKVLSLPWIQPKFQGFGSTIRNINTFSFNARNIDGLFTNSIDANKWQAITELAVQTLNDSLIASALQRIPAPVYAKVGSQLATQLGERRQDLFKKSPQYFRFLNRVIDLTLSDKNEWVMIQDTLEGALAVSIRKLAKSGEAEQVIYQRVLDPRETRELRLYLFGGSDSVQVHNNTSRIRVRIIGKPGSTKTYALTGSRLRNVHVYEGAGSSTFLGQPGSAHLHLSDRPSNTALALTDRYNKTIPMLNIGYNIDDGLILGGGVRFIRQGFRKSPYAASHQFNLSHSFATAGWRFRMQSEWLEAIGRADILFNGKVYAPDNTQNFFGRGNETKYDKTGNFRRYYRTVFTILQADPAIRWRNKARSSFSIGPSVQYYQFDADDNKGRFITQTARLSDYDSATLTQEKIHLGAAFDFTTDSRNHLLLPSMGTYFNVKGRWYDGLNKYSRSFAQFTGELDFYRPLDRRATVVIANRMGGGATFGTTAFYQSLFLGGHENLLGYRQYRFAGRHMAYNNFEARIRLANVASYYLPGQLGLVGFYDIGRVWEAGEHSKRWHQGVGGGIYFSPAQLLLLQLVAGSSGEGLYPYFTMGFRF